METKIKNRSYGQLPGFYNLDQILSMPDDIYVKLDARTLYQTSPTAQLIADRYCQLAYRDFTLHMQSEDKAMQNFHDFVINKINSRDISLDGEKNLREIIQQLGMSLLLNGNAVWRMVEDEGQTRVEVVPIYHQPNGGIKGEHDESNYITNKVVYNKKTNRHYGYKFDENVEKAVNEIHGETLRTNLLVRHTYRDEAHNITCPAPLLKISKRAGYVDRVTNAVAKNTVLQNKIALYIKRDKETVGQSTVLQDLVTDQVRKNEELGVDQSKIIEHNDLGAGGLVEGLLAGESIETVDVKALGNQIVENFINKELQLACNTLSLPFEHFMMSYDSSYAASMNIDVLLRDFIADAWRNLQEPIRQLIRILSLEYGKKVQIEKYLANLKINPLSKSMGDMSKQAKAFQLLDSIDLLPHDLAYEMLWNSPIPAEVKEQIEQRKNSQDIDNTQ